MNLDRFGLRGRRTRHAAVGAPRIRRIELSDFRAFPAVQPAVFDLGTAGSNLLVFGENGAGKSSLYRGLRGLFSLNAPDIMALHNVFSEPPQPRVATTMTDGTVLVWTSNAHPTAQVRDAARRAAFLTHTRLTEMNRGVDPNTPPNLFEIAVDQLLSDFEATLAGGVKRSVGELWRAVHDAMARRITTSRGEQRPRRYSQIIDEACGEFNEGMRQALDALEAQTRPVLRRILGTLSADALEFVGLTFPQVRYDRASKTLENRSLTPSVKFRGHALEAPQGFLNEARLSALAIAIYFAARLACVPTAATGLKLLVMDDLLLSLDSSHRRPILEAITELFAEWQIVLLTHDRYWFELAREQLANDRWKFAEMFEQLAGDGLLVPLVRPALSDAVVATLKQAEAFLAQAHTAAAANYARSACELALRRFCARRHVPFPYFEDNKRPDLSAMLTAARQHMLTDPARAAALRALEPYRQFILNPLSHDPLRPVPSADVAAAIAAVKEVALACSDPYPNP